MEEEGGVSKETEIAESPSRLENESCHTEEVRPTLSHNAPRCALSMNFNLDYPLLQTSGSSTSEEAGCGSHVLHSVARQVLQSYGGKEGNTTLPVSLRCM